MKKFVAFLLAAMMILSMAACTPAENPTTTNTPTTTPTTKPVENEKVLTYAEFMAAEVGAVVTVETYVQAHQNWWENKISIYGQDRDGGIFLYEMPCSEELASKLAVGTKIRVTGEKAEFHGEIEIMNATKMEIVEGGDTYIAEAQDLTDILANEAELIKKQNVKALFKGLTIEKIEYRNGEPGDDIYVTVKQGENTFDFCVEVYLTGVETDVYKAFADLKVGDKVDIECFVYWWDAINAHITAVKAAA